MKVLYILYILNKNQLKTKLNQIYTKIKNTIIEKENIYYDLLTSWVVDY